MLRREALAIGPKMIAGALHDQLADLGARLIVETLTRLPLPATPQPVEGVTYAAKISPAEAQIDWSRDAVQLERQIRAFAPVPGAWCLLPDGARLKLLGADVMRGSGVPGTVLDDQADDCHGRRGAAPHPAAEGRQETHVGRGFPAWPEIGRRNQAGMIRFRLTLEYDGGPFVGWQRQENGLSVQLALENAIRATVQEDCLVYGAGRTDAGVHALAQVAHVDIAKPIEPDRLMAAINFHVRPNPVVVTDCSIVTDDFHARFSAMGRAYLYRLVNRRAPLAIDRGHAWFVQRAARYRCHACGGTTPRRPSRLHNVPGLRLPGANRR